MPGAVPLEDLPNELRGMAVPEDDLPSDSAGGGPQKSRHYVSRAEQNTRREQARRKAPSAFPELAEPTPGFDPLEAQNKGNSDAGAALLNLTADSTVNLPGNVAGFLGKVAGQVGRNFDPSIDPAQWRQKVSGALTLPHTQRGDEVLSEGLAPVTQAVQQNVTPFLNKHPLLGAAVETGGTALEGAATLLGLRGAAGALEGAGARATAAELSHKPYTRAPVADVAKRYTVVPEDAQHSAGMSTTGDLTGSTRAKLGTQVTDSEIPVQNVKIATQRATQDLPGQLLGPNGRVDKGLLRGQLDAETVPYQQVAQLPPPPTNTLAQRVHQAWQERGGSLKGDAVAESRLMPLMDPNAPPLPTDELLRRWREVNGYASDLRKASGEGSAAAQIKGADLRSISDAILNEIDDRAAAFGSPELVQQLKTARVNMARLHALDDATDSVGWVDPAKLAAMAERHEPLTGGLAEVAADAAAAPRSLRPMSRAIDSQGNQLDRFGREPASWMRNVVGHLGGNLLARRGVEALNQELRAGSGLLRQPVPEPPVPTLYPANGGPQPGPVPPSAPPGLFAEDIPGPPSGPAMPGAGRPEPGQLPFNQLLAERMAGDLQLEGQLPPAPATGAPRSRPLDVLDFIRGEPPAAPGQALPAITQDQLRLAPDAPMPFQLQGAPDPFARLGIPGPKFGPGDEFPGPSGGGGLPPGNFSDLWAQHVMNGDVPAPTLAIALEDAGAGLPLPLQRALEEYGRPGAGGPRQRAFLNALEGYMGPVGSPDEIPGGLRSAPAMQSISDLVGTPPQELSLADIPRTKPNADFLDSVDTPTKPGAQFVTSPNGYLSYTDVGGRRVLDRAHVAKAARGQGEGKANLLQAAKQSAQDGIPLDSGNHVKIDQLRVYDSLRKAGKLIFDVDEAALQKALAQGTDLKHNSPVFSNIRPAE